MPIHIIPTRISTAGKTLNSIIPINPAYAAYQMGQLLLLEEGGSKDVETAMKWLKMSAEKGTEVRNSADENVKIYNIKHSHQPI